VTPQPPRTPLCLDVRVGSALVTAPTQAAGSNGAVPGGSWGSAGNPLENGGADLPAPARSGSECCRGLLAPEAHLGCDDLWVDVLR